MSDSPLDKKNDSEKPEIQFTTENIGRWASKQENPFAKQNRERQAKRRERDKKREKAAPFIVMFGSALVIGVALWGLVMLIVGLINRPEPEAIAIAGGTTQDMVDYRDKLQNLFNQNVSGNSDDKLKEIQEAVDDTLSTTNGRRNENAVKIAQMLFLSSNWYYDEIEQIAETINPGELTLEQKSNYYDVLFAKAQSEGDYEKADELFEIVYQLSQEIGGEGGGS